MFLYACIHPCTVLFCLRMIKFLKCQVGLRVGCHVGDVSRKGQMHSASLLRDKLSQRPGDGPEDQSVAGALAVTFPVLLNGPRKLCVHALAEAIELVGQGGFGPGTIRVLRGCFEVLVEHDACGRSRCVSEDLSAVAILRSVLTTRAVFCIGDTATAATEEIELGQKGLEACLLLLGGGHTLGSPVGLATPELQAAQQKQDVGYVRELLRCHGLRL
mmetsp:Transcript_22131/g.55531  ORF Transcript_22131/g.55531 Transcript_22131/m.55531 type:complete len:216 (-) Transcript_22131:265-912(-)